MHKNRKQVEKVETYREQVQEQSEIFKVRKWQTQTSQMQCVHKNRTPYT